MLFINNLVQTTCIALSKNPRTNLIVKNTGKSLRENKHDRIIWYALQECNFVHS